MKNIRKELNKELPELLDDFINESSNNYFFDYTGIVVDNNDPEQLGRCRIRVYGIYESTIPDSDLPWALPEFNFIGSKVGNFIVPPVDAIVKVRFDHGNIHEPVYTTKVINTNSLPSSRTENYPDTMVFWETDNGTWFTLDRSNDSINLNHKSGTIINIDENGKISITGNGDIDIKNEGNVNVTCTQLNINDGNLTVD